MGNLIEWMKIVPTIIGAVLTIMAQMDTLFPGKGQGSTKLAMAKAILTSADSLIVEWWPKIEAMISAISTVKKTLGLTITPSPATPAADQTTPATTDQTTT